ncbi:hypothetical protein SEVIR_9G375400v4 [Setaria viridis]|uniref:Translation elongation factor EF1B beta/delta subunit guanine nucleotide exchange domain-containing protein n=1 Tax=Setaria viridis TaxID=4556 RepID=A0A4U6T4F5_SETVI|nr:hypothetical protein SEVIR_9G375400v2 [Setaria viridis]
MAVFTALSLGPAESPPKVKVSRLSYLLALWLQLLELLTQRHRQLMKMMTMMMLTYSVRRLKRSAQQLKHVRQLSKLLARRKSVSGKSSALLDVKPWDDETDMQKLEQAVRSVKMEGLLWGASKLVPVGYGIKKMQIMMTIVDDLVSVDSLIEDNLCIEPANEYIQSCDIVAFNKIRKLSWTFYL